MRRAALAATIVLDLAFVATAAASAAPTRAEFIRKGDAICRQVQRQLAPLRRKASVAKTLPAAKQWNVVSQIWKEEVAIQIRFNARFNAIGVPVGDKAARGLVVGLDQSLTLAREIRDAFAMRDMPTLQDRLPTYLRFMLKLNRRVAAYGFTACGH